MAKAWTAGRLKYGYLFRLLVERDLRERYAGSWMGLSWSLIQPAALFGIYDLVFSVILRVHPDPVFAGVPFADWLMAGLAPWLFLAEVLARSPVSVTEHARMVSNNAFPNELLPTVTTVSACINHLVTLALLALFLAWKGILVPASIPALLPWMGVLLLLNLGVAWFCAAVGAYFRDLAQLAGLLAMAWGFATPIFYPEAAVPAGYGWLLWLNPACLVVRGYRLALLGRPDLSWRDFGMAAAWAMGFAALGYLSFRRLKRGFADQL